MVGAASVYGVPQLVTDKADSPHLAAQKTQAELYFACAEETDHWAPLEMVQALDQSGRERNNFSNAEVELHAGVELCGFAFPQRAAYDKPAAERHWERLFAMWKRQLS